MLKLYYTPGACSLSPHIALREAGLPFELEQVDLKTKKTKSGDDYAAVNPNGYVPALKLNDGEILTEGPAIVQWIADQRPSAQIAPANGTIERTRLQEWLAFISSEVHKTYSPLFGADTPEAAKQAAKQRLIARYRYVNEQLKGRQYLVGDRFTVADGYLFVVTNWAAPLGVDLSEFREVKQHYDRVASRPKVIEAMKAEGLIQ